MRRSRPMTRGSNGVSAQSLRAKTARIARKLEQVQGVPEQSRRLPSPMDMLIATILSQNTSDRNSHRAYTRLRERFATWEDVVRSPLSSVKAAIRIGGMANQKAVTIRAVLRRVKSRYGDYDLALLRRLTDEQVIEELTTMKGVGVKTAACVLLFSMGRDVFPVDTHVHRICTRLGLAPGSGTPEQTFSMMQKLIPRGKGYSFHTNLIRFGRRICRSFRPACDACPIYKECLFDGKSIRRRGRRQRSRADHDFMLLDNVAPSP